VNTVFIVTAGEYSAYHIVACFENREAAEAAVKIYNREGGYSTGKGTDFLAAKIEEWPMLPDATRTTEHIYQVIVDPEYGGPREWATSQVLWGPASESVAESLGWNSDKVVGVWGRALTPARAKKITQDRAAELKAREAGIA
jgi:hypothetical protein